jgi:hypothetical protein
MKKLMLVVFSLILLGMTFISCTPAAAEFRLSAEPVPGISLGLTSVNLGNYYDFKSQRVYGGFEASVINVKNVASLDLGALTNGSRQAPLVAIGLNIIGICNKFGWEYKLPGNLQLVGFYSRNFFYESEAVDFDEFGNAMEPMVQKWFAGIGLVIVLPINQTSTPTPMPLPIPTPVPEPVLTPTP